MEEKRKPLSNAKIKKKDLPMDMKQSNMGPGCRALGLVVRRAPQLPILDSDMCADLITLRTQNNLSKIINHLDNVISLTEQLITCDIYLIFVFKLLQNLTLVLAKYYITTLNYLH